MSYCINFCWVNAWKGSLKGQQILNLFQFAYQSNEMVDAFLTAVMPPFNFSFQKDFAFSVFLFSLVLLVLFLTTGEFPKLFVLISSYLKFSQITNLFTTYCILGVSSRNFSLPKFSSQSYISNVWSTAFHIAFNIKLFYCICSHSFEYILVLLHPNFAKQIIWIIYIPRFSTFKLVWFVCKVAYLILEIS